MNEILSRIYPILTAVPSGLHYIERPATCFACEINGREYLVTASHSLTGWTPEARVFIFTDDGVTRVPVRRVHFHRGIDVAVICPASAPQSGPLPLAISTDLPSPGDEVFAVGFPAQAAADDDGELIKNTTPYVMQTRVLGANPDAVEIDGLAEHGMSGGPVLKSYGGILRVVGVISKRDKVDLATCTVAVPAAHIVGIVNDYPEGPKIHRSNFHE